MEPHRHEYDPAAAAAAERADDRTAASTSLGETNDRRGCRGLVDLCGVRVRSGLLKLSRLPKQGCVAG